MYHSDSRAAHPLCCWWLCGAVQDNVALIAVLEMVDPDRGGKQLICVANTHIHANPELNDVKLWQVHTLLKGLEKIANR
jgi:CCR4-NOT transcription complex subunit 6